MSDKKSDMERIGLFQEMSYVTVGDPFVTKANKSFNEAAGVGKQMLPGGSKENSALQHGYFEQVFKRVFDGEAYSEAVEQRRRYRKEQSKKNISERTFLPSQPEKKRYANVTLNPYPAHSVDPLMRVKEDMHKAMELHKTLLKGGAFRSMSHPQAYFDSNPYRMDKPMPSSKTKEHPTSRLVQPHFKPSSPGKRLGGSKMGTFDPYPPHSVDPFNDKLRYIVDIKNNSGKSFLPQPIGKSRPVVSIADYNILCSINVNNYKAMAVA